MKEIIEFKFEALTNRGKIIKFRHKFELDKFVPKVRESYDPQIPEHLIDHLIECDHDYHYTNQVDEIDKVPLFFEKYDLDCILDYFIIVPKKRKSKKEKMLETRAEVEALLSEFSTRLNSPELHKNIMVTYGFMYEVISKLDVATQYLIAVKATIVGYTSHNAGLKIALDLLRERNKQFEIAEHINRKSENVKILE